MNNYYLVLFLIITQLLCSCCTLPDNENSANLELLSKHQTIGFYLISNEGELIEPDEAVSKEVKKVVIQEYVSFKYTKLAPGKYYLSSDSLSDLASLLEIPVVQLK